MLITKHFVRNSTFLSFLVFTVSCGGIVEYDEKPSDVGATEITEAPVIIDSCSSLCRHSSNFEHNFSSYKESYVEKNWRQFIECLCMGGHYEMNNTSCSSYCKDNISVINKYKYSIGYVCDIVD